jgi:hypothetical protein
MTLLASRRLMTLGLIMMATLTILITVTGVVPARLRMASLLLLIIAVVSARFRAALSLV